MSSTVTTRVDLAIESAAGPFGNDWKLEDVRRVSRREATEAAEKLVAIAAEAGIRLTIVKVSAGCSVKFDGEDK